MYVANFEEKNKFLIRFLPFYRFDQKKLLKKIQIFLRICAFSNLLRKTNILSISVLFSEIVNFLTKKRSSLLVSPKMLQTKEKHSLAVCGSLWRERQFLLLFVTFYWFDQKQLFKQIKIFLRISHFSNLLRKTNFLSIFVLYSEIITFLTKKRSSRWISPKMLQNKRKAYFTCMLLSLGRIFFFNICPLLLVWSKTVV